MKKRRTLVQSASFFFGRRGRRGPSRECGSKGCQVKANPMHSHPRADRRDDDGSGWGAREAGKKKQPPPALARLPKSLSPAPPLATVLSAHTKLTV